MLGKFLGNIGSHLIKEGLQDNNFGSSSMQFLGSSLGKLIENQILDADQNYDYYNNSLVQDNIHPRVYGCPIALVFGQCRIFGKIIWSLPIEQKEINVSLIPGQVEMQIRSFASFAVGLCEGRIDDVNNVWFDDETVDLSNFKYRLYKGSETQAPDPLIISCEGKDKTPAFRGLAYIVFEDLPLETFENKIPNFSFEVRRKPKRAINSDTRSLIKNIAIIPGHGEFKYDTIVQKRHVDYSSHVAVEDINSENHEKIADCVYSLNQLINFAPNLNWVNLNVAWFCDNSDIAKITILPAVEDKDDNISYSEQWQVSSYRRNDAYLLKRDKDGILYHGGTPSDNSLMRFATKLKQEGLKILFNPLLLIDNASKTWRGEISGAAANISNFFGSSLGYRNFILHYANLLKGKIDGFIIASEFVSLNNIRSNNTYPAIDELIKLAKDVKEILGPQVLVSYSADWTEYKNAGWDQLENLWACSSIDFVGLNFKFPKHYEICNYDDILDDEITAKAKKLYAECCFGLHSYLMQNYYDWKNLLNWWNSNGKNKWLARSKNIWFCEFVCAHIDEGCNNIEALQINPKLEPDISMQQHLVHKSLELLKEFTAISKIFLCYWDVTPYPICSHAQVWEEGDAWECAYCLQNKFSGVDLASTVAEICAKGNIDVTAENFALNKIIQGVAYNTGSLYSYITQLSYLFNFDISEHKYINFIDNDESADENKIKYCLTKNNLVKSFGVSYFKFLHLNSKESGGKLVVNFIARSKQYKMQTLLHNDDSNVSQKIALTLNTNTVLSHFEASQIAEKIGLRSKSKQSFVEFCLPVNYMIIKPNDSVEIYYDKKFYITKIMHIKFMDNFIWFLARITSVYT
ncbi:MAG: glycoside hydrolase TIM-barrel-like domain-containing protein [Rickettsiaceae bacterium]|nr:glycoside hydrolase TIM-barrel-like domain-containing protein [Rickettsiaceae bacterium]